MHEHQNGLALMVRRQVTAPPLERSASAFATMIQPVEEPAVAPVGSIRQEPASLAGSRLPSIELVLEQTNTAVPTLRSTTFGNYGAYQHCGINE